MLAAAPHNVNTIAENFDMSRQAVSLHIKILTESGLIIIKQKGRDRYCEAHLEKLNEVSTWIEQYRQLWEKKFDNLDIYLENLKKLRNGEQK